MAPSLTHCTGCLIPKRFGTACATPKNRGGNGKAVTPDGARQFGQDIGRAIARTLSEL